ncbi:MAG TPA: hypothetical protein VFU36_00460, partial [Jatrophihabitans sp.]|nr:hypothetical protein [Jatrophihabitans sp.]
KRVQRMVGDNVPLFAAEALRARPGVILPRRARSIDFLRWEIGGLPDCIQQVSNIIEKINIGRAASSSDVRYKWDWLRAKVAEFAGDVIDPTTLFESSFPVPSRFPRPIG